MIRCAHISDLHFSDLKWKFSHLLSKRAVGYLNLLFKRRQAYSTQKLSKLKETLKEKGVSHVLISGDLSSLASQKEFEEAKAFVSSLKEEGFVVFVIPGNHDKYIKQRQGREAFYHFFGKDFPTTLPFTLEKEGVCGSRLDSSWWIVGLDTSLPTSLISSCGLFSEEREKNLRALLSEIPKTDSILLMNHYPLFNQESRRKMLYRADALKELIQDFPSIRCYLHGHTHRHCLADLRPSCLPVILDSGSISQKTKESWNLLTLQKGSFEIESFFLDAQSALWERKKHITCNLESHV